LSPESFGKKSRTESEGEADTGHQARSYINGVEQERSNVELGLHSRRGNGGKSNLDLHGPPKKIDNVPQGPTPLRLLVKRTEGPKKQKDKRHDHIVAT